MHHLELSLTIPRSVGGNRAILWGGLGIDPGDPNPYNDADGGTSIRLFNPTADGSSEWTETAGMTSRRWYPTVETLEDGSVIIIGGSQ